MTLKKYFHILNIFVYSLWHAIKTKRLHINHVEFVSISLQVYYIVYTHYYVPIIYIIETVVGNQYFYFRQKDGELIFFFFIE